MKKIFSILRLVITVIAILVFIAGIALTTIGIYEFITTFFFLSDADKHHLPGLIAMGLLKSIDMFLLAIVFFIFSLGLLILFSTPDTILPVKLPEWLRIKDLIDLKIILWEAILTTLVVSYLANLAEKRMAGEEVNILNLVIPGVIFLISISLYFLKKR